MLEIVLDTNVIFDFLGRRKPFYDAAENVLAYSRLGDYRLWMSASQVTDVFYIASGDRASQVEAAKRALTSLRRDVRVCSVGECEIDAALASPSPDFEDEVVIQAARSIGAQLILTRDKGFIARSTVPALAPQDFFGWLRDTHGIDYGLA